MKKSLLIGLITLPMITLFAGFRVPAFAQTCDSTIMSCANGGMSSDDLLSNDTSMPTSSGSGNLNGSGGASGWLENGGFEGHSGTEGSRVQEAGDVCQLVVNTGCQVLGRWAGSKAGGGTGAAIGTGAALSCQAIADTVCGSGE